MIGLLIKTLRETWFSTLLAGAALCGIMALLTYVIPQIQGNMFETFEQFPFVKPMLSALLGTEVGEEITATAMQSLLWVHPTVLAVLWVHEVVFSTRTPAGEIDRGTIDFLLGLPISRRILYVSETLMWLLSGVVLLAFGLVGHRLAAPAMPPEMRPTLVQSLLVLANLYCVYTAVGGIAFLISAASDRKGRAMSGVFAIVLASFLLNFVAQFWDPAKQFAFLGVLNYYQPAKILQSGEFPFADVAVLFSVGAAAWAVGGEIFARRSICTV